MSKLWRHRVQLAQKRSAASAFPSHSGRPDPKNLTSTILERDERREEHVATTPRRFVRLTLTFSKSVVLHEACLLLFLHRYHLDLSVLLK